MTVTQLTHLVLKYAHKNIHGRIGMWCMLPILDVITTQSMECLAYPYDAAEYVSAKHTCDS